MKVLFADIPFVGEAIATINGKEIWSNHISGDCPPDICLMEVDCVYIEDGRFVFELKGE